MADYLTTQNRMEEATIADFVIRYSNEDWVTKDAFIKKDNYFKFNDCIQKQIHELEGNTHSIKTV